MQAGGVAYQDVVVLDLLRTLLRQPERYGVTPQAAQHARERFLELATPLLEREGGRRAWLEHEFER